MLSTQFCAACGAVNEAVQTQCFACGHLLTTSTDAPATPDTPLLRERYQLGALLGSGGYSTVYRARDLQVEHDVAIKQINLQGLSADEAIEATDTFNREASVLSSLHHPQIPQIYDQFNDQDHWYLVLQYLEGPTLETYLETREAQSKPLQFDEVLSIALQLCDVLNYLHTRQPPVIFRDLKPSNIICTPPFKIPCLVDFGIARRFRPGQKRDTQALGSPGYAAPEQYGRTQTTPRSDIYSLGALIHHLLSGHDPAEVLPGLVPLRLRAEIGEDILSELVQRMLSADPEQRPENVRAVIATLEAIKQLREAQPRARIWYPPVPQDLPDSSAGGQQVQMQVPLASSVSSMYVPGQGGLSRRKVLKGLGTALAVTGLGGMIWLASEQSQIHPLSAVGTSYPPTRKGSSTIPGDLSHTAPVNSVAWSPNGRYIASGSNDQTVHVLDITTGKIVLIYRGHKDVVTTVVWSPDSNYIASGSADHTVQIWEANTGKIALTYRGHTDVVAAVAWSPDGKQVASASGQAIQIWDVSSGKTLLTYSQGEEDSITTMAWSPTSKYIVSSSNTFPGSNDNTASVWETTTGKTVLTYRGHTDIVTTVAWSPDGKYIVSGSADKTVQVWQATSDQPIHTAYTYAYVNSVAWSPDGKYIAVGTEGGTQVSSAVYRNDNVINTPYLAGDTQEDSSVNSVSWSPDSQYIASGSFDMTVQVWNVLNQSSPN